MRKSSTPPIFFDILGLLIQLCLKITRPYYFWLLCLWFNLEAVCKVTEWQTTTWKKAWPNNGQVLQNRKMLTKIEPRKWIVGNDIFKSLHIQTQYKTCISKVKIEWLQNSNRTPVEAAFRRCSSKYVLLKMLTWKHLCWISFLVKLACFCTRYNSNANMRSRNYAECLQNEHDNNVMST